MAHGRTCKAACVASCTTCAAVPSRSRVSLLPLEDRLPEAATETASLAAHDAKRCGICCLPPPHRESYPGGHILVPWVRRAWPSWTQATNPTLESNSSIRQPAPPVLIDVLDRYSASRRPRTRRPPGAVDVDVDEHGGGDPYRPSCGKSLEIVCGRVSYGGVTVRGEGERQPQRRPHGIGPPHYEHDRDGVLR